MDVTCANCGEPWDTYHMRHDEIWETDLPESIKKEFTGTLTPEIENAFENNGWRFAYHCIVAILRCPCCDNQECDNQECDNQLEKAKREIVAELLGDDLDGAASIISED